MLTKRDRRTTRLRGVAILVGGALLGALPAATAWAEPTQADRDKANTLASDGQDALDKGDYPAALDRFTRADAIIHVPTLVLGIARADVGLGRLATAKTVYERILAEGNPDPGKPVFVAALRDAKDDLAKLAPRVPTVTIVITGAAASSVTVDGASLPLTAIGTKQAVDPGVHVIRVVATGSAPAEATIQVPEGADQRVPIQLASTTPAPAPQVSSHGGQRVAGIVLMASGGALLVVGAATGGLAIAKHNDLKTACPGGKCTTTASQSELSQYHVVGAVSTVGIVVGAAAAAAGVIVFATAPKSQPARSAFLSPTLGWGYAGISGAF